MYTCYYNWLAADLLVLTPQLTLLIEKDALWLCVTVTSILQSKAILICIAVVHSKI